MTLLAALSGATVVLGLILLVLGLTPRPEPAPRPAPARRASRWARLDPAARRNLAAGLIAGVVVWAVSGWAVAILALPALAVGVPALLRPPRAGAPIPRLEALEEWTRSLAGVLVVGAGLEQALITSARSAPTPIAREVTALAARLRARTPTEHALRAFADDLADPTADLIVLSLILASRRRGAGLASVLEALGTSVAREVSIRRSVESERAKLRTTSRSITAIALIVMGGLFATGTYVAPYRTPLGSLILLGLLAAFIAALLWMRALGAAPVPARLIQPTGEGSPA